MKPNTVAGACSAEKVTNRMFDQSVDPEGLICLALADDRGRIMQIPATNHEAFLYECLAIFRELMACPYVMGRDLIDAGLVPGKNFTDLLAYTHKLRLAGIPKENVLKQTLSYARKNAGK